MTDTKKKKRIGVIRGGQGNSYNLSLKKGGDIISHINENLADTYKTFDILIDRSGVWHLNGLPIIPSDLIHTIDIVWNTSDGSYSDIFNNLSIPHISVGAFSLALENSKDLLREHMKKINIDMPRSIALPFYQEDLDGSRETYSIKKAKQVHGKFGAPWIVKSFTSDANMAIHLVKTFPQLVDTIEGLSARAGEVDHNKNILIEEFITGKIASVHSVQNFRNEDVYHFPLGNTFGTFTHSEKEQLYSLAHQICDHVGAQHYLKSDFVLNPKGKIYMLGITTTPNLKLESHFAEVCGIVGVRTHDIIYHILQGFS